MRYGLLAALLTILVAGTATAATFPTRIETLDARSYPGIEGAIRVFTEKPQPAPSKDDFTVTEDGVPVADFDVALDPRPLYVVLVLDRSGSMKDAMPALKRAAAQFIDQMKDGSFCALVAFSSDVRRLTGFSNNPAYLKQRVAELAPDGETALWDAVGTAVDDLVPLPDGTRRVAVAFTDGVDQNAAGTAPLSTLTPKGLAQRARTAGVPVYFLGMGSKINQELLAKLAVATGGQALFSAGPAQLAGLFKTLDQTLDATYRVTYRTPRPQRDGTVRAVQVTSRLAGTADQGAAKYRAPMDPAPVAAGAEAPPAYGLPGSGRAALRRVFGSLLTPQALGAHVDTEVQGWSTNRELAYPVRTGLDFAFDGRVGAAVPRLVSLRTDLADRAGSVQVQTRGSDTFVSVGGPGGTAVSCSVDGASVTVDGNLSVLATGSRVATLLPLPALRALTGGASVTVDQAMVAVESGGSAVLVTPDCVKVTGAGGETKIFFDAATGRPTTVVAYDPKGGATTTSRYSGWLLDGAVKADVPAPAVTAGVAAPAVVKLAGALAAPAVVAPAALGVGGEALGAALNVASASLDLAASLTSLATYDRAHAESMQQFAQHMVSVQGDLERNVAQSMAQVDQAMKLAEQATRLADQATQAAGQSTADALRAADEATRAADEAGRVAEEAGRAAEQLGTSLGRMGTDLGRMGTDLGRMGTNLGKTAGQTHNLKALQRLQDNVDRLQQGIGGQDPETVGTSEDEGDDEE